MKARSVAACTEAPPADAVEIKCPLQGQAHPRDGRAPQLTPQRSDDVEVPARVREAQRPLTRTAALLTPMPVTTTTANTTAEASTFISDEQNLSMMHQISSSSGEFSPRSCADSCAGRRVMMMNTPERGCFLNGGAVGESARGAETLTSVPGGCLEPFDEIGDSVSVVDENDYDYDYAIHPRQTNLHITTTPHTMLTKSPRTRPTRLNRLKQQKLVFLSVLLLLRNLKLHSVRH